MSRNLAAEIAGERRTLDGTIYDELHNRIVKLKYLPGKMIFENEVATEFGVSRTPVRQAFFRLARDELLQILPQRGARVSYLSIDKVRESQAVREYLETAAFSIAARTWDESKPECEAACADIEATLQKQAIAVASGSYDDFTMLDEDFHRAFMRYAGNMTLYGIVCDVRSHINRVRYVELQEGNLDREAVEHHRQIFAAVRKNNVEQTVNRLVAHLNQLEQFREELFVKRKDIFV